jgi:hypothetical protein
MAAGVIVLEFNELVPALLNQFIDRGYLQNFKRLRDEAIVATTDAEEAPPLLEPWIQWVTVHAGVPYSTHGCFHLSDGANYKGPRIWDLVSEAGGQVWICGSMNAGVRAGSINGHVLPDPWATGIQALPYNFFEPYINFVRPYVQEHSTGRPNVALSDVLRCARFMALNGLSAKTVWATIRQLLSERRDRTHWRRATILDQMQWDIFKAVFKANKPQLATFFLNSTAHFQHFHWREMEPAEFSVKPTDENMRIYSDAVLFGYAQMDKIVGDALSLAGNEHSLVLCTALSQQPMLNFEEKGGRQIFRHHDHVSLLEFAGVAERYEYSPIMSQQFFLTFKDQATAQAAAAKIEGLRMENGEQLMLARIEGTKVLSGCMTDHPPAPDATISSIASNKRLRFWDCFYPLNALRSGMHHADGALWVRTPSRRHLNLDRKVSLLEIAPTLMDLAGVSSDHRFERPPIAEVLATRADEKTAA